MQRVSADYASKPEATRGRVIPETENQHRTVFARDRDRIIQVLSNLLDNAVKYTPKNKGIRVKVACDAAQLRIEVIDEGAGMKPDELSKLFTVFTQLSNAKEGRVRGTGLGLSISKKIVELHGGTIGVLSDPGTGSTFYFTLPYHAR